MRRTALIALTALTLAPAHAQTAQSAVELGVLDCRVGGGSGFVIGSTKEVSCTFNPSKAGQASETYRGTISKLGIDVGTTKGAVMRWLVVAPKANAYETGALAGRYFGASAEATAGVGAGANVLVGGSKKSFTLQPVSVQTQEGVNLALGVSEFALSSAQ